MYHLGIRLVVRIHDKKFFLSSPQKPINPYLAVQDADNCTGPCVEDIIFVTTAITEDDNDLVSGVLADERLETGDPICQGLHVRLVGHSCELAWLFSCHPCHGYNNNI
jgi:hypothetical protein